MKTTRPPRETHDVSKTGKDSKLHASWSSSKKSESSVVKAQPKLSNK